MMVKDVWVYDAGCERQQATDISEHSREATNNTGMEQEEVGTKLLIVPQSALAQPLVKGKDFDNFFVMAFIPLKHMPFI